MTKRTVLHFLSLFFAAVLIGACSAKKGDEASGGHQHDESDQVWQEMDEFHMIMAESFHPFKDSANLEPAKSNAVAMAAAAEKWLGAPLPEKVNNEETKSNLKQLSDDTKAFVETVNAGDDALIGESLTDLHDHFHSLQESWYGGHSHEGHH